MLGYKSIPVAPMGSGEQGRVKISGIANVRFPSRIPLIQERFHITMGFDNYTPLTPPLIDCNPAGMRIQSVSAFVPVVLRCRFDQQYSGLYLPMHIAW